MAVVALLVALEVSVALLPELVLAVPVAVPRPGRWGTVAVPMVVVRGLVQGQVVMLVDKK